MKRIYLDYASLTPMDKGVLKCMKKYSSESYTNPSALYESAVQAKKALEEARSRAAQVIHAHPDEIIFTSGGTEGNRLALNCTVPPATVISAIEHSSIRRRDGVMIVSVDNNGIIDLAALEKAITAETRLVSVMFVNNEIGTIEPVADIAKIIRQARARFNTHTLFHVDACQAAGYLPLFVEKLGVDLMTLDGAKIYGPRGVGMLYVKRGAAKIERAGTENIPGIMGFVAALEKAEAMREKEAARLADLKQFFLDGLHGLNPSLRVNGSLESSSPHILNVSIPGIDSEFFILELDAKGIECSTKSACLRDEDESYVLKAIGADSRTSVRFSFGRDTRRRHLKKALKIIAHIVVQNLAKEA